MVPHRPGQGPAWKKSITAASREMSYSLKQRQRVIINEYINNKRSSHTRPTVDLNWAATKAVDLQEEKKR